MMPRSLAMRLLLAALGGLYLASALISAVALWVWPWSSQDFASISMVSHAETIEEQLHFDASGHLQPLAFSQQLETVYDAMSKDLAYQFLDEDGHELYASPSGPALEVLRNQSYMTTVKPVMQQHMIDAAGMGMYLQTKILQSGNGPRYVLRLLRSQRMDSLLRHHKSKSFMASMLIAVVLAQLVFIAVVVYIGRRLVRPLREVSAAAASITPRNLRTRLQAQGLPLELRPLIEAFNHALERLEQGYQSQQDFLAAAAHELKTPLALFRAEIEVGKQDPSQLLKDVDLMARQVHQLLHLAEVSEARNYCFEVLDMKEVVCEVRDYMERYAFQHNVALDLIVPDAAVKLRFDRGAVFVLIRNLVENGIEHAEPSSSVHITLRSSSLSVKNRGAQIPIAEQSQLYTRFCRGSTRRTDGSEGAGLGLAICHEIATAHEWDLSLQQNASWPGVGFSLRWSRSASIVSLPTEK
jgi:two-component system sensor histidine kinase QseC